MDYYPFGSIRLDEKAGTFSEQRKFIGQEYDADTGLSYMNARYYNGTIGRFISQDPLAIESLQTADNKKFQYILANPQNWNTYSYALNNPLVASDPSGLLTIFVPGTNYDKDAMMNSDLGSRLSSTFGEQAKFFYWNVDGKAGPNDSGARSLAATALAGLINDYSFAQGEKLNIVAHSHGGNVVMEATSMLHHTIDNLVTLGTPVRPDYQPNMSIIANHVNAYSTRDGVQINGGNDSSLSSLGETIGILMPRLSAQTGKFIGSMVARQLGGQEAGTAGRTFNGAFNIDITQVPGFQYKSNGRIGNHNVPGRPQTWAATDTVLKEQKMSLKR